MEYFRLRRQEAIENARRRQKEREKERQSAGSSLMSSVWATQRTADKSTAFTKLPDLNPNSSGAAASSNSRQSPVVLSVNEGAGLSETASYMTHRSVRFTGEVTETNNAVGTQPNSDASGGIMFPGEVTETGN